MYKQTHDFDVVYFRYKPRADSKMIGHVEGR